MGLFSRRKPDEARTASLNGLEELLRQAGYPGRSATAAPVTVTSAVTGTVAIYAATSLLADTISSLPVHTYAIAADGETRQRINPKLKGSPGERIARLVADQPNPEMTPKEFYGLVEAHIDLWGNAFINIVRGNDGYPIALWPLQPDRIVIKRDSAGAKEYAYRLDNGQWRKLAYSEVCHITGYSYDGTLGVSPITVARDAIALDQASAKFGGAFFANGAQPSGILTSPGNLSPDQAEGLRREWDTLHAGINNAHRVAVLYGGMDYKAVSMPPKDAQFVELRRYTVSEAARLYRIPPHLLSDVERSTSWGTGIEEQSIGYVVYTIRPKLEGFEQAFNRDFSPHPGYSTLRDDNIFIEFAVDGLLRGDQKSRYEAYESGIRAGWMLRSEPRRLENLPPVDGFDEPLLPNGYVQDSLPLAGQ